MAKGTHGRSKSDKAFDQIQRDIRNINFNERKGIFHKDAVFTCISANKKKVKLKKEFKDSSLTQHIAGGYDRKSDPDSAYTRAQGRKDLEKELNHLSKKYDIPIEILRKNPKIRPMNAAEIDAAWDEAEAKKAEEKAAKRTTRTRKSAKREKVVLVKSDEEEIDYASLDSPDEE